MSTSKLAPTDLDAFATFGIGPELLEAAGVCRVTDSEARGLWGIRYRAGADLSGILFPYVDPVSGHRVTARLRRDHPDEGQDGNPRAKYLSPFGDNRHLFFAPGSGELLGDTNVPVVLVEAEKSALALSALSARTKRRLLPVATGGCWGWMGKTGSKITPSGERAEVRGPLADFQLINRADREIIILFDANTGTNPRVRGARRRLAEELESYG